MSSESKLETRFCGCGCGKSFRCLPSSDARWYSQIHNPEFKAKELAMKPPPPRKSNGEMRRLVTEMVESGMSNQDMMGRLIAAGVKTARGGALTMGTLTNLAWKIRLALGKPVKRRRR